MPYYSVLLHGTNIKLAGAGAPAIGFYTTRVVRAASDTQAAHKAEELVFAEWAAPPYVNANTGGSPRLTVESVDRVPLMRALRVPNGGYTFYEREDTTA